MADDLLPLLGVNNHDDEGNSSDSDGEAEGDNPAVDAPAEDEEEEMEDEENDENENEQGIDLDEIIGNFHVREDDEGNGDQDPAELSHMNFDPALPGEHSYLGDDLEEVRGRTVHEDDTYLSLPILSLPGVVLMPGQTLPLHLFQPTTVSMIRHVVGEDRTFGLVTSRYLGHEFGPTLASIGTTAEIFSIKEEQDDRAGITTVRVKATGRQRFEIKETRRQSDGIVMAKVRILPERILPDVMEGARPPSHVRLSAYDDTTPGKDQAEGGADDQEDILRHWLKVALRKKKVDRFSDAHLTWWPPWVYKQYDVQLVMQKVKDELRSWNETLKPEHMPTDPTDFSFWVAGNLPLDDGMKLRLLRIDSAVQRLRFELSIMQRCTVLCCKDCGFLIANKKDVFSMAVQGPLGAYVNPGGYVHETLTVYKAHNLNLVGRPSTENSWFPGYAWTIVQCRHCHHHMGWKFTSVKRRLQPEKFWGLCRSSLLPGLQNEDENGDASEGWSPTM